MVIDVSGAFRQLSDCWFPAELNAATRTLAHYLVTATYGDLS